VPESARPRLGALEEHVFREVREAPLADRFVAPTDPRPEMNRDGRGRAVLLDDEPHAVGQHFTDGGGQAARSRRGWRRRARTERIKEKGDRADAYGASADGGYHCGYTVPEPKTVCRVIWRGYAGHNALVVPVSGAVSRA
jgi:hypothetical protein